jgi:hypothetical protein
VDEMKRENLFYLVFVLAIVVIRLLVFLIPEVDFKIGEIVIHHFWIGAILIVLGFLFLKTRIYLFGIGFGLAIDQVVFLVLGGGGDSEYWAFPSLVGVVVLAVVVYLFRKKLAK